MRNPLQPKNAGTALFGCAIDPAEQVLFRKALKNLQERNFDLFKIRLGL